VSTPRPKFCVGEQVNVIDTEGRVVIERHEIIAMKYSLAHRNPISGRIFDPGWIYALPGHDYMFVEKHLQKVPDEDRIGWQYCIFKPEHIE